MLQRAVGPQVARAALLFGMRFDAESAVRHGLALSVADDPVAAALELAAGPAAAPRDVVLATKATMRATASPGSLDVELHELAKDTELGPQATSIQSPEFAARLAAAQTEVTAHRRLLRAGVSRQTHDPLGSPQYRRIHHRALECEDAAFINGRGENVSRPLHLLG